jgi:outer membrane lipoprotein SlyB
MMKTLTPALSYALAILIVCAGCATGQGGRTYTREQARKVHSVYYGTILRVEDVTIEAKPSGLGTVAGGVVGGVMGSTIGGGRGSTLATAGGAVVGAVAGAVGEKKVMTKAAVEVEVELDDGRLMVVVQEKDDEFIVGDRVRIIEGGDGTTRVRQ